MTLRAAAILTAIAATVGLLASPIAILMTAFLFDDSRAGGWPVSLLAASIWSSPLFFLVALSAAGVAIAIPRLWLVRVAAVAFGLPLAMCLMASVTVELVCGGSFVCRSAIQ